MIELYLYPRAMNRKPSGDISLRKSEEFPPDLMIPSVHLGETTTLDDIKRKAYELFFSDKKKFPAARATGIHANHLTVVC